MAVAVRHSTVATLPDQAGAEINKAEWNADHTITGLATVAGTGAYSDLTGTPTLGTAAAANTTDFDAAGAATDAVATHVGLADPHTQYALESSLAAIATSGSGADLTAASVTYAKIQNVSATDKMLGRSTAGAGVIEEISVTAAGRALIDDADAATQRTTLGLNNVTNDAQTKAAVVPNTAPSAGQVPVGNAGNTAYAPQTIGGDATLTSAGSLVVTKTNGSSFGALATKNSVDVSTADATGTLAAGRFPALTGDVTTSAGSLATAIGTGKVTRTMLEATGKNWQFLGSATGATTTVGPVIWTGTFIQLMIKYWIAGYNGGTPVGRILLGTASISTTGRTNSYSISEGVTAPTTASGATATPGCPLAVTLSAVGRGGTIFVDGASGSVKSLEVFGRNQTPAVATVPTLFRAASFFSDLGTNLALLRAQLTVYDTLTATAVSSQTFTSGTYLAVWGRNTD